MQKIISSNSAYDVIIVGAGPAGSSVAIRLASAGLKILLIEKNKFPREKLCGEFISPECLNHFEELGVMPEIDRSFGTELLETIFFNRKGKGISFKSEWFGNSVKKALGLSRAEMDNVLIDRAKKLGVDVCEETTAGDLIVDSDKVIGIKLRTAESEVYASLVIDATGRTHALARQLEKHTVKIPAKFVAFKTHLVEVDLNSNACEIYSYKGGYGGCNAVEDGLFNLCFIASANIVKQLGSDPDRVMREVVFRNRRASNALSDAVVIKPWLAVPIDRFGQADLIPANGLITIGDAAAFIDPFTGSGILLALESAKIASNAILAGSRNGLNVEKISCDYKASYSTTFHARLRVCSMLRHAAFRPWLAEKAIGVLGLNESLRRSAARATRGVF